MWDICSENWHLAHERIRLLAEVREMSAPSTRFMLFVLVFQSANHDEGEVQIVLSVFISIKQRLSLSFHVLQERFSRGIRPPTTSLLLGTLVDLTRGKSESLAENAL